MQETKSLNTEVIDYILDRPVELCHQLGFTDMTELHNKWIREFVLTDKDMTLQAHRESYKSTALSVALAIIILLFPQDTTLFMRKTDTNVKLIIKQVKKILKSDLWQDLSKLIYGRGFELTVDNDISVCTDLVNTIKGDNQLDGLGCGSALTSKHYKRVFTDDIITLADRVSKAEREKTKIIYQELQNIKTRDGVMVNIGTPWHKEDAFTIMPKPEVYDCYSTGLMSQEQIEQKRKSMTPTLFSANYELKHIADENALFKDPPKFFDDISKLYQGIGHIDASYGGEDGSALTLGHKIGEKLYLYGKRRTGHIDNYVNEFIELTNACKCGTIYCEDNGDKGYLARDISKKHPARTYHETTNKYIKISTHLKQNWGNIYFYKDTDPEYLQEIMDYTEEAQHDDSPDSASSMVRQLSKNLIIG